MLNVEGAPRSTVDLLRGIDGTLVSNTAKDTLEICGALIEENKELSDKILEIYRGMNVNAESPLHFVNGELNPAWSVHPDIDRDSFLRKQLRGNVLVIGSGGFNELAGVTAECVYTDIRRFPQKKFVQADATRLPFADQTFDSLYSAHAVDSYDLLLKVFPEMSRVLRKPEKIVLVPHLFLIHETLQALKDAGIDTVDRCELALAQRYQQHNSYPLRDNHPLIYVTLNLD